MIAESAALAKGFVCRHHSGRVYTILEIANSGSTDEAKFPLTVCYVGANGRVWARPISQFREKFDILFSGTTLHG